MIHNMIRAMTYQEEGMISEPQIHLHSLQRKIKCCIFSSLSFVSVYGVSLETVV